MQLKADSEVKNKPMRCRPENGLRCVGFFIALNVPNSGIVDGKAVLSF
jgi:hypothetical protein